MSDIVYPSEEIVRNAIVKDYDQLREEAASDPVAFWVKQAQRLDWYETWHKALDDTEAPFFKWFVGGKTNIVLNALDRHQHTPIRNKLALIWEGEDGSLRTFSYFALNREVCQFAAVLKSMGVQKGDRVTIYMPRVPELMMAMLACAKIGAVHSVVYGGFSVEALHGRIEDSESRVLITADGGYLRGKIIPLKQIADEALQRAGCVEHVVVIRRTGEAVAMEPERDYYYDELMSLPLVKSSVTSCETEVMDAEDPLFLLYTSGTTGKPKAIIHTHGGYQVGISTTMRMAFDIKPEDRWWCAADPGWITGHSYIVYGPSDPGYDVDHVRGCTDLPLPRPVVANRRKIRRQRPLHRSDRNPRIDAIRRSLGQQARHLHPSPARHRWRAHQPGGMAVVPPCGRQRALSDHRHLVADRNRSLHDHAGAVICLETGIGYSTIPRDRRRGP